MTPALEYEAKFFDWLHKEFLPQIAALRETISSCPPEPCGRCDGTGTIDAQWSGTDPCCPECDGTGEA